tara:strand:- start:1928 stop:2158 length:231 start_codon:yes stop_codon:yes gene_type:complete
MTVRYDTTILQSKTCTKVATLLKEVTTYINKDGRKSKKDKKIVLEGIRSYLMQWATAQHLSDKYFMNPSHGRSKNQ